MTTLLSLTSHYLVAFMVALITVGLKGFQHKNVIGNHYKLVFVTSYFMALGDVLTVGLIVKNGWEIAIPLGTGAAFGMIVSMWLHARYVRPSGMP